MKYTLSDDYFKFSGKQSKIGEQYVVNDIEHILSSIQTGKKKIGDMEKELSGSLTRNQLKYLLPKLLKDYC